MNKPKLIRITTVPVSLKTLLKGQHRYMSENGLEVIGIASEGIELHEVEKEEQIRTIAVEMTRTISPLMDLKSVWQLYKIFKREQPLIVHTHTPKAGTVGMLAAKLAGVPHRLHTVAGLPLLVAKGNKRKLLDFVEKRTYSWATKVYPNSKGLYDIILNNKYTAARKLKVIGKGSSNGIDTAHFDPSLITEQQKQTLKHSLGIAPEDFVYVFVGRIVKDKGINELVESFNFINKENSKTKLILVGVFENDLDPLKPEIVELIHSHPDILSVGYQSDVRPYFAIADVFTFPSYREGFPNVLMQSCAMGIASIATDINGCNEIVEDGYTGLIVPAQNQKELQEKMLFLLQNSVVRETLAKNCRKKIVDNYGRQFVWQELLKEYNGFMNK